MECYKKCNYTSLSEVKTKDLVNELARREGVDKFTNSPFSKAHISIQEDWNGEMIEQDLEGPNLIFVVID